MHLSNKGLLTTLACDIDGQSVYALEGSVFIAGAVIQWLRDELKVIPDASSSEKIVTSLKDNAGVYFVPAFVGLGAPYWDSDARGTITGVTRGTKREHLVRAALESIAYQTKDVFEVMKKELGRNISELKVDGGACKNNFLMKFQADLLNCKIIRPTIIESTAYGVAQLAGVTVGILKRKSTRGIVDRVFVPTMSKKQRDQLNSGWQQAVRRTQTK